MRRFFTSVVVSLLFCGAAQPVAAESIVQLPLDFSATQGLNGVFYESYSDNRPTNILNPGSTSARLMNFDGVQSIANGSTINTGPMYSESIYRFPYIIYDTARDTLLIHPGTGGYNYGTASSNIGSSISFVAPTAGSYNMMGAFARANNFQNAGDGVDVVIFRDFDAGHPLFSATISSDNAVDPGNYFQGSGVANFDLNTTLLLNEVCRFVVFSDSQGQDGTFDLTAFTLSITPVPEPSTLVLSGICAAISLLAYAWRRQVT